MLQHVKVGDVLKNRAGDFITIKDVDHVSDYPILYVTPRGNNFSVTIAGRYFAKEYPIEHPNDIIDPTIYNIASATAESSTFVEPVNYIESRTIYNLGHIITLPNGTQIYQSNTGHTQLIPQLGASI